MADRYYYIGFDRNAYAIVPGTPKAPYERVYYYEKAYKMNPYVILYPTGLFQMYMVNYAETNDSVWIKKVDDLFLIEHVVNKNHFLYWFDRGVFYQVLNVPLLAIYNYQKAEELDPFNYETKMNMSLAYKMAGKIDKASIKQKEADLIHPRKEK